MQGTRVFTGSSLIKSNSLRRYQELTMAGIHGGFHGYRFFCSKYWFWYYLAANLKPVNFGSQSSSWRSGQEQE
jgi:hypothetical protein